MKKITEKSWKIKEKSGGEVRKIKEKSGGEVRKNVGKTCEKLIRYMTNMTNMTNFSRIKNAGFFMKKQSGLSGISSRKNKDRNDDGNKGRNDGNKGRNDGKYKRRAEKEMVKLH